MRYRGFSARIQYDDEDETFFGYVVGARDRVSFQGNSVQALKLAFRDAVDDWLHQCGRGAYDLAIPDYSGPDADNRGAPDVPADGLLSPGPGLSRPHPGRRVRSLRWSLGLTQQAFAARYRIPVATLRDWERGQTWPDPPARAYLRVIAIDPDGVWRALADHAP